MPQFDLLGMQIAEYTKTATGATRGEATSMGDAMNCRLELRIAEGRLYAEGGLAELLREANGGTISVGVKHIPKAAQQLLFGFSEKTRALTYTGSGGTVTTMQAVSLAASRGSTCKYVSFACFAPDMIDKQKKYTCFFVACALFSPPAYELETKGETIRFATPTTTGEFLPDDSDSGVIQEVYVADEEAEARAWCKLVVEEDIA